MSSATSSVRASRASAVADSSAARSAGVGTPSLEGPARRPTAASTSSPCRRDGGDLLLGRRVDDRQPLAVVGGHPRPPT
jgi:hypothetical protein